MIKTTQKIPLRRCTQNNHTDIKRITEINALCKKFPTVDHLKLWQVIPKMYARCQLRSHSDSPRMPNLENLQCIQHILITERLKITLQNILFHRSWPVEWSSHPHPECWIPVNFQATTENSSLSTLLDYIKKKKKNTFTFSKSSSFSPSLASLYLFEQCLRLGVIGTSSVCLLLQD